MISLALLAICLYRKVITISVLVCILFFVNTVSIFDQTNTTCAGVEEQNSFKLYSANINKFNKDLARLKLEIQKMNADIVFLMEITPEQMEQIETLIDNFPYHIKQTPIGTENMGMVFLSKFPMVNSEVIQMSESGNGFIRSELVIDNKSVMIYGVHLPKTTSIKEFSETKRQILWFANNVARKTMPVIVAGDMNATPYSPLFRKLLKVAGLKDTRTGFEWQPTWPAYFPLLWIPIDHILASPGIQIFSRGTGSFIGSDHFPVIAELSVN
jgi:endonuclease/exonuclease/phosphatase (EEP) superfamily protein YafD